MTIPTPSAEAIAKLESQNNIWFGSVRPDGRPHLTPIWFVWVDARIYVCIDPDGVKSSNIHANPRVVLALEDGSHPVICEGMAQPVARPLPETVSSAFLRKYEWDLDEDKQYTQVVEISPRKWLAW